MQAIKKGFSPSRVFLGVMPASSCQGAGSHPVRQSHEGAIRRPFGLPFASELGLAQLGRWLSHASRKLHGDV